MEQTNNVRMEMKMDCRQNYHQQYHIRSIWKRVENEKVSDLKKKKQNQAVGEKNQHRHLNFQTRL